jgi:hypothetical protein
VTDTPPPENAASGIPDGFSRDPDYWYRRLAAAQERLDEEAAQRIAHYVDMDRKVIGAAVAQAAAAERERAEALIVQAQDYARDESERAGRLAALALKILNQCVALHPTGEADYLDEWSMALDQLEVAAGGMPPRDSDPAEDAYQAGIKAERERIVAHLESLAANYPEDVFPAGSDSRDAVSGCAMRHAYRNAARSVREDLSEEDGDG